MSWFSKIFGVKDKTEIKEVTEAKPEQVIQPREYKEDICGLCNVPIGQERWKKVTGKLLHKRCFKLATRQISNGG